MSQEDYYKILGVSKSATQAEIKKAYHKLAKQYHPDSNHQAGSEQTFKKINEAYDVLKDEQKKAAYDRYGHDTFQQRTSGGYAANGGHFHGDINDIFGDFFSDFMGSSRSAKRSGLQTKGADLKYNLTINLEEAFTGIEKNISFTTEVKCSGCNGRGSTDLSGNTTCGYCSGHGVRRMQQGFFTIEQTCNHCHGAGQVIKNPCASCHSSGRITQRRNLVVHVPSGIENGTKIRLTEEGEAGLRGGKSGDLYVFITVKAHEIFKTEGADLHCKLPISFTTAALGGEVEVPVIDGDKVKLKIPAGTQNGDKLRLRNKGMSKVRSQSRGDMLVHTYVEVPKQLTKKQTELLIALDKELGSDTSGFLNKMKNLWTS